MAYMAYFLGAVMEWRPTRAVERTDTAKSAVPPLTAISVTAV
jgi:hypothetical protein